MLTKERHAKLQKKYEIKRAINITKLKKQISNLTTIEKHSTNQNKIASIRYHIVVAQEKLQRLEAKPICDEKDLFSYKLKRWFFGIGKEFLRIDWTNRTNVFMSFFIIIIIIVFLALLFLLLDVVFVPSMKTR